MVSGGGGGQGVGSAFVGDWRAFAHCDALHFWRGRRRRSRTRAGRAGRESLSASLRRRHDAAAGRKACTSSPTLTRALALTCRSLIRTCPASHRLGQGARLEHACGRQPAIDTNGLGDAAHDPQPGGGRKPIAEQLDTTPRLSLSRPSASSTAARSSCESDALPERCRA